MNQKLEYANTNRPDHDTFQNCSVKAKYANFTSNNFISSQVTSKNSHEFNNKYVNSTFNGTHSILISNAYRGGYFQYQVGTVNASSFIRSFSFFTFTFFEHNTVQMNTIIARYSIFEKNKDVYGSYLIGNNTDVRHSSFNMSYVLLEEGEIVNS